MDKKDIYNLIALLVSVIGISGVILYSVLIQFNKQRTLHKFEKQKAIHFFNKKAFLFCLISVVISTIVFVFVLLSAGLMFLIEFKIMFFINSIITSVYFICLIITYFIWRLWSKSIYFIIVNDEIIVDDQAIKFENIHSITNDEKRKNIIIHYINTEKKGTIITIKYNWELKDLIIENKINNHFI
ncbi:hypothetical protein EELLY_v1c02150 [Entomoplasma ellychniae]|uniref:Transmembrane protein n=1 Tax=Entomoplasma ellychniae TaxID=2114 RepID=A0A8E2QXR5_9MOLU|nr:hypothetical protein [Entomoplasma ellychniae]PPE04535.1 hypothetical protein EELLY_v1c02150 [Entomoplasma ellychniae]